MKPLIRDLFRLLGRPTVVLAIILLGVASALLVTPGLSSSNQHPGLNLSVTMTYSGQYIFAICAFDSSGNPIAGADLSVTLSSPNSSLPPVGVAQGQSSPEGLAILKIGANPSRYTAAYSATWSGQIVIIDSPLATPLPNQTIAGPGVISIGSTGEYTRTPVLIVSFAAPTGTPPSGYSLTYTLNESHAKVDGTGPIYSGSLGVINSLVSSYRFSLPVGALTGFPIEFSIENASGTVVASETYDVGSVIVEPGQLGPDGTVLISWIRSMEIVTPLVAGFLGYAAYGRDRVAGSLEPILCMPFSPQEVLRNRLVSAITAAGIGCATSALLFEELLRSAGDPVVPLALTGALWLAFFLLSIIFIGLVTLFAHVVRSTAGLVGSLVSAWAAFSILWADILVIASGAFGVSSTASSGLAWQGEVGLWSPVGSTLNPISWELSQLSPGGSQILATAPEPFVAGLALVAWLILPLAAATVLAKVRD
jgi:hypothetical protein